MEHPHLVSGLFLPASESVPLELYRSLQDMPDGRFVGSVALTEEERRREGLGGINALLLPPREWSQVYSSVASLERIFEAAGEGRLPDSFTRHLGNVLRDLDNVAVLGVRKLFQRDLSPPPPAS